MSGDRAYGSIRKRLTSLRNLFLRIELSVLALTLLGWFAGLFLLNVLITYLPASIEFQRLALFVTLAVLTGVFIFYLALFIRRWPSLEWIAAEAERATPELEGDLLRGALDLWKRKDDTRFGYSPSLIEALVVDALKKSDTIRDRQVIGRRRLHRHLAIIPAALLIAAFLFMLVPDRTARVARAFQPVDPEAGLFAVGLSVEPGDCTVRAGSAVKVAATFSSYGGDGAELMVRRAEGAEWKSYPMGESAGGEARRFNATLSNLEDEAEYVVRFDGGESRHYLIAVTHPPVVTHIAYRLDYPDYTGLEDRTVDENHGNVQALYGTEVVLEIRSGKEVAAARIRREEGDPITLVVQDDLCTGAFSVTETFSYVVELTDHDDFQNVDPIRYDVTPVADENPFVRVTYPAEDRVLEQEMKLPVRFAALDDYGVREVNLLYDKNGEDEKRILLFDTEHRVTEIDRERVWDLADERLLPTDVVTYYLEVWDNDPFHGPKRSVSRTWTIRMPSLAQMFAELTDDREADVGDLEEVYEESEKLEEKLEELAREIQKSEEMTWDEKKKIEGIMEKQKEIEEDLREVAKELEESAREMEENRLVTPETIARLQELNELLQEVATDEMRKAMEELAKAMEELNPEEIDKAAEQLQLTQQDFMERLDRTIDMLKQMKDMQTLDALAEGMRRMAEEQRELREETAGAPEDEMGDLSEQEEALKKELQKLQEQMRKLAEESAERSPEFSDEVKKTSNQLEQKQTGSKMKEAAEKLKDKEKQSAMKKQQEAEQDLFEVAFKLTDFRKACQSASQSKAKAAFGESIRDLLHLSDGQEALLNKGSGKRRLSVPERRGLAEIQQEMKSGIDKVMEKVRDVGRDAPQVSSSILDVLRRSRAKAEEAAEQYESGDMSIARVRGGEVLVQLNHSVVQLLRSQENYNSSCSNPNGQGQSGEQMQQMTQRQQGLSQQMSQVPVPSSNPGEMTGQTQANVRRMAAEQKEIRKGMEELAGEVGSTSDVLGSLDDIVEEMRNMERDLESANITPETRERQEKILSRMLDAQRSMRERGYKRERRSESGNRFEATAPVDLPRTLSESRDRIRDDLVRMPNFEYPPEYEELIRSYFRALTE